MYLVPGGVPGHRGCVSALGGTWSRGRVPGLGGVPGPGCVCVCSGGCTWSGGVPGSRGVYLVRYSPPVNRMNDRHV